MGFLHDNNEVKVSYRMTKIGTFPASCPLLAGEVQQRSLLHPEGGLALPQLPRELCSRLCSPGRVRREAMGADPGGSCPCAPQLPGTGSVCSGTAGH